MKFNFKELPVNSGLISLVLLLLFCLRIGFIWQMGLMPQDAYYHYYAEHLSLSYFDHPPAIAYLLRTFSTIFGKREFALKLADTVTALFTAFLFYRLASCFLSRRRAGIAVLLFFSTLMFSFLSLVSTPDVPLMLFWTITLIWLYRAIFFDEKAAWIWSGIFMGLAFDSKYTAVFLFIGLLLFLLLCKRYRSILFTYRMVLVCFFFLVASLPVIIWNVANRFISFRFQLAERIGSTSALHFSFPNILGVMGHQSGILLPILFFGLLVMIIKTIRKFHLNFSRIPAQNLFLLCFFLPLFLGFFVLSSVYWIKLNWMMPCYISGIIWLSTYIRIKWVNRQIIMSFFIHILLMAEVAFYIVPLNTNDTWYGWPQLAASVKSLKHQYPDTFIFSADGYKTSAILDFYLPDEIIYGPNAIGLQGLQFNLIQNTKVLKGRNALFIAADRDYKSAQKTNVMPYSFDRFFTSVTQLPPIIITKRNVPVRKFLVFYCKGYLWTAE